MQEFEYNGFMIATRSCNNTIYFRANDVTTALGYKLTNKGSINKFVSPEYITTFGEICGDKSEKSHTKYIQKNGVLELAFKSRLETAKSFQKMLLGHLDKIVGMAIDNAVKQREVEALEYKTKLAITEQSHEALISQYKKRIEEQERELDEKDEEIERKVEIIETKDTAIEELENVVDDNAICASEDYEIRIAELEKEMEDLREENWSLKEILNNVPEEYRGDYVDEEWIPSKKSRVEKVLKESKIDKETELNAWFKQTIAKLRLAYENVDKWKTKYANTESTKAAAKYSARYDTAHAELDAYVKELKRDKFFDICATRLAEYPYKFWLLYNGKLC
jgi:prophage antirepressor-like protein